MCDFTPMIYVISNPVCFLFFFFDLARRILQVSAAAEIRSVPSACHSCRSVIEPSKFTWIDNTTRAGCNENRNNQEREPVSHFIAHRNKVVRADIRAEANARGSRAKFDELPPTPPLSLSRRRTNERGARIFRNLSEIALSVC